MGPHQGPTKTSLAAGNPVRGLMGAFPGMAKTHTASPVIMSSFGCLWSQALSTFCFSAGRDTLPCTCSQVKLPHEFFPSRLECHLFQEALPDVHFRPVAHPTPILNLPLSVFCMVVTALTLPNPSRASDWGKWPAPAHESAESISSQGTFSDCLPQEGRPSSSQVQGGGQVGHLLPVYHLQQS